MMSFDGGTAYAESDADDEYERSMGDVSPVGDSEASPIDSELSAASTSAEHTPTTYGGQRSSADRLPETIVTEWTADECAEFIGSIGLQQYGNRFLGECLKRLRSCDLRRLTRDAENEIVGEALVALHHDDLKSMGIASVGHRLTILKSVYDVKKAQDVPMESDHYLPLSADAEAEYATATLKDINRLVQQLRLRDERMSLMEQDFRRMSEDYRRLREDVLPALRMAKDANRPLPNYGGSNQGYGMDSTLTQPTPTPPPPPPPGQQMGTANAPIKRQYSQRKILIGAAPKSVSPTQTAHERSIAEQTLDPASAAERAVLSSTHLAAMNGSGPNSSPSYPSPNNMPSPTSPQNHINSATLASRSYRSDQAPSVRTTMTESDHAYARDSTRDPRSERNNPKRRETPVPDTPSGSNASVEIFKSFRVSLDDPCHKVLPAALKKYQINAPWDQYALYIVYGDQERCLGMDEKPLILFKQLDKEGKKPMFMLRKTGAAAMEGEPGSAGIGSVPGGII